LHLALEFFTSLCFFWQLAVFFFFLSCFAVVGFGKKRGPNSSEK
jgi:hypothetical protein